MACFIVPMTEAVATTIITKVIEKKEKQADAELAVSTEKSVPLALSNSVESVDVAVQKRHFSDKMKWLNQMLWGGSALLAFEHLWHGEISPFFPFLTAAESKAELSTMFHEMGTVGVGMAVLVTFVWTIMVALAASREKDKLTAKTPETAVSTRKM